MNVLELKYNDNFVKAFCLANGLKSLDDALRKAERQYHKILTMPKPKPKKKLTYKQALARKTIGDKMQMIIQDMIGHIKREIAMGSYSWSEFINDPTVYFDSQVMKSYYNNYIIRQAIISYFKNEYIPF